MDGRSDEKDGDEQQIFYKQYVVPGRTDPKKMEALK